MHHPLHHTPNRLRKYRKMQGYSQKDVAKILGYKRTARISLWEKGLSIPSVKNLIRLSILYNVLADQLYIELREEFRADIISKKEDLYNCNDP
jgi:transcriptional regulator with XRE-family HTH domain